MLALILAAALALAAAPPEPGPPHVITSPDWQRWPSREDMSNFYPARALRTGAEGHATIRCSVTVAGRLADCVVAEESPTGQGFGDAALKMSALFTMRPMTRDGIPAEGGVAVIPFVFQLPGSRVFTVALRVPQSGMEEGRVDVSCWVTNSKDLDRCSASLVPGRQDLRELALKVAGRVKAPAELEAGANLILRVHVVPGS